MNSTKNAAAHIRKATISDIPFIKTCLIDSWVEHAKNHPELMTEERMRQSKIEEYYLKKIENKEYVLIAEAAGVRVGLIAAYIQQLESFFKNPEILYIDDVYVVPKYRKLGIAQLLLSEIDTIAKKNGIKRIDGKVYSFNKSMQKLLGKMNYHTPYSNWVKVLE